MKFFQGVTVPKGSFLHLRWAAANIDPQEWAEAKSLKLDRKAGTRHLTFSQGARVLSRGTPFSSGANGGMECAA